MNRITFPLKLQMKRQTVADLQDGLRLLLDNNVIQLSDTEHQEIKRPLEAERAKKQYGRVTRKLVEIFQQQHNLRGNGRVDKLTAEALNTRLQELGVLDEQSPNANSVFLDTRYVVACRTVDADGKPINGLRVETYARIPVLPQDALLGKPAISDRDGDIIFRFKRSDFTQLPGKNGPDLYFKVYRGEIMLEHILPDIRNEKGIIGDFQPQSEPVVIRVEKHYVVTGIILQANNLPAKKLTLFVNQLAFGGVTLPLGAPATDAQGRYALAYNPGNTAVNMEIRVENPENSQETILLVKPRFGVSPLEVMNLIAPAASLEAEYRRQAADLEPHIGEMTKLAEACENAEHNDLTMLNRATGWDARLIALSATAAKLSTDPDVNLPQEAVYGLLRAGLPSNKQLLAQVRPNVAAQALKAVRDAGIIAIEDQQIDTFKENFTAFANKTRLAMQAPGSSSTYTQLLDSSEAFPNTDEGKKAQENFANVVFNHRGDAVELWDKAKNEAGLSDVQIGKLQLQGKLAFLAGNSAKMTTQLMGKKINNPAELVEKGFYKPDTWETEIRNTVGTDEELATLIPPIYAAEKVEGRLHAYAADMARKVRLSYPTQVIAQLIEDEDKFKPLANHPKTVNYLRDATKQGFRLGETPITAFFETHVGVVDGLADDDIKAIKQDLYELQRIYQITPGNEAMPVLNKLDMTSAYDVTAYSEEEFGSLYRAKYLEIYDQPSPPEEPRLIYRKAKQVSSVTYNLFAVAKKLDSETHVRAISGTLEQYTESKSKLKEALKDYPTMESLFGSMDFCECEHCRSVLSPAAYLVDLLQFVDDEKFLERWKARYGNREYPSKNGSRDPISPYEVLVKRRPDIPHIPLTCENTHTALPYIDIVNEILEYYVANETLTEDVAHDTGEATTAELLAEPQYVIREAYQKLREARYPLNLPFDLWIETARQFCNYFETPLDHVLETFRPSDDLFSPTQSFDRATIFMESLGLSPAEVDIFTDTDPLKLGKWQELFGYPRAEIDSLGNTTDAIVNVPNSTANLFRIADKCTYYDSAADTLYNEEKEIKEIGEKDSGGQGKAKITIDGVWTTPPKQGDFLVLSGVPEILSSAKALSRRLGVTYKEIAEIAQTGFVNPTLTELALPYKLGVTIQDARFYRDQKPFYEQNKNLMGKAYSDLNPADQERYDNLSNKVKNTQLTGWEIVNEVEAFELRLKDLATEFGKPLGALRTEIDDIPFDKILVLADTDAGCNFDLTTLRYADGTSAKPIDFLRINLFVRLWRKLGWSIAETDRAMSTFIPQNAPFNETPANLLKQPLKTALIYMAHLKTLDEKVKVGKQSRLKLLTLWSPIATKGKNSLYAQLFLTRSVLKADPVFDDPLGNYLADSTVPLKDHMLSLQGALSLTADDISRILADTGDSVNAAKLTLSNISLLYRYGLLAKALKLTVGELITLKQLSGLDPFKQLHPESLADTPAGVKPETRAIDFDYPFSQTLRFVEIAAEVKDSGLDIEDLDYLLRHRFDEIGKYRPNPEDTLALLKTLAEGIRAIRAEYAVPNDPGAISEEVLRQKLGLVLPAEVVERFLAMMNGTAEFITTIKPVTSKNQLSSTIFLSEPAISLLAYNETKQEQKLVFRGVLFDDQKKELKTKFNAMLDAGQQDTWARILDDVQVITRQQTNKFFVKHLKKQSISSSATTGFLEIADLKLLFEPLPVSLTQSEQQSHVWHQRTRLAKTFFPFLQQRLIRQLIVQTMAAHTSSDPVLIENLLTDERLLTMAGSESLLASLAPIDERGISATFFDAADLSGDPHTFVVKDAYVAPKDAQNTSGNPPNSARFGGYLEVPTPGAYRFYIELGHQDAEAELRFDHLPDPVFLSDKAQVNNDVFGDQPDEFLELIAGVPYRFTLELKKLNGGGAQLLVQGETLPKDGISQLTLYPLTAMTRAEGAILLLTKVLQLIQSLGLSEREIRYMLTHDDKFDGLDLKSLSVRDAQSLLDTIVVTKMAANEKLSKDEAMLQARSENPDLASEGDLVAPHFKQFLRLAAYARLKRDLAPGTDDIIDIFEANDLTDTDRLDKKVYPLIAKLARRDEATVKATTDALVVAQKEPVFENEKLLLRLWAALQVVERFGVPANSLLEWTCIASPTASAESRFEIARDLKKAIKARFEPETWQRVAQPIFDKLRQRQRDALVAHVMHQHGFDRMEKLYEHFLIDPGMEPVVQTSRIRLAIASVQLFIQRCLLNLERMVHPATINSKHWEWMKRYRVWEANRKIFLFPENWLEPEFRDDKTHLFSELEGTLLQGDVSSDLVEDAFLNYLKKLDELARLDIVAMHIEDSADPAERTLHVFGRTYSQPHKYFYRRYVHQMWTPWEPVTAEVEGDHLAPVIWRDRLYLFWVTFMDKPEEDPQTSDNASNETLKIFPANIVNSVELLESYSKSIANTKLTELTLGETVQNLKNMVGKKTIDIQLHWSEYLKGEWSTRESGIHSAIMSKTVLTDFKLSSIFIHVSKAYEDDEERGVYIHLSSSSFTESFYLEGRNSTPKIVDYFGKPINPYKSTDTEQATRYEGSGTLSVTFIQQIVAELGELRPVLTRETSTILQKGDRPYTLLPCDNKLTSLGISEDAYQNAENPEEVKAVIEGGLSEIESLIKPVFYQDNQHTFFVEPSVTEQTIEEYQAWVMPPPQPETSDEEDSDWEMDIVTPHIPEAARIPGPNDPPITAIDPDSLIIPAPEIDWLVNPATILEFDGALIGPTGQPGLEIRSGDISGVSAVGETTLNINPGNASGNAVILTDTTRFEQSGLVQSVGALNVVSNTGLEKVFINKLNLLGLGTHTAQFS